MMVFAVTVLVVTAVLLYLVTPIHMNRYMRVGRVFVCCVSHFLGSLSTISLRALSGRLFTTT